MKLRLICAALVIVLAIVAGVVIFGSGKGHHSAPAVALHVATQPPLLPGVYDTPTVKACLKALKPVTVTWGGPGATAPDGMTAGRMAFYGQAHRYDKCTGRDFEATAAKFLSPAQRVLMERG